MKKKLQTVMVDTRVRTKVATERKMILFLRLKRMSYSGLTRSTTVAVSRMLVLTVIPNFLARRRLIIGMPLTVGSMG